MNKLFFIAAIAVSMTLGFTSCNKCQVCTKTNSPEVRVCDNDYDSATQYGAAIDGYEATGYDCQ